MNYEELYEALTTLEKDLKDAVAAVNRQHKATVKNIESGNLTELRKTLAQMEESAALLSKQVANVKEEADNFDAQTYFAGGDFTKQLLEECEARDIDVRGEKGVYEMFPFKLRIYGDTEHAEEVWINRKKIQSIRPKAVVDTIKASRDKLYKAAFKPESFMNELADAYDMTCLKSEVRNGTNIALAKIYKTMTPMARARKDYDMQAFSFDLARLYEEGPDAWVTKGGRSFIFGTSRDGKSGIRVLSKSGAESYITTIRPLANETE